MLNIFTLLYNHHLYLSAELFPPSKIETLSPLLFNMAEDRDEKLTGLRCPFDLMNMLRTEELYYLGMVLRQLCFFEIEQTGST